ncbi:MAG: hypothetical protein K8F93_14585 [Burkholderiales bacterium]|nr:hypothetical protein [Burkholderiales bacterium]
MNEKGKESVLFCKPDWSIVCTPEGCFCEYRMGQPTPPQLACVPPAQIQCAGTMCMCAEVRGTVPIASDPTPAVPDCGVVAALAAASIYKALLACR